jgi:hypothetical protein
MFAESLLSTLDAALFASERGGRVDRTTRMCFLRSAHPRVMVTTRGGANSRAFVGIASAAMIADPLYRKGIGVGFKV